ncbi:BREX-2 system adenine-specific DNA-methyltransferase PglX [Actinoallomurus sp. NBC_01490]|uniref:BREX-2 system adenine-specific DNA-methyltransferase PglX n=1 Tax=Actinoallomurus sp. NBC_01490 TaxID=2903557 RepID=UPI002E307825|nr:BREX-2 system adenine-specific DNA-methyltransferase PglX [Actinoallomurus sp. NBC_01490]
MIDRAALLGDLKAQVRLLEDDLRERAGDAEGEFDAGLRAEWRDARSAERIAATYETWLEDRVTQSAVAWVLGTVFLRFCEDNELIDLPYLAGPGERLTIASERQQAFFERPENREKTDREWIVEGFDAMAKASPVAGGLFDRSHNPMWRITPSLDAAKVLIAFWRRRGADGQDIVHDFTDPEWNTRFLGDLYQDLSEHAKKTYALLQTPEFVEEFILDLTLDPAIEEFGLDPEPPNSPIDLPRGLRVIDPTCGSGHFLLGAFKRLLKRWEEQAPDADRWDLINRVLYSVHGVDKNPSAVAIARFRLLLAAMQAGGATRLANAPDFYLHIAIGDSLLHGRGAPGVQGEIELPETRRIHSFTTEDVQRSIQSVDLLGVNSYHVVVGNPPYITVKDAAEDKAYRKHYPSCSGAYALSVPFAERFFNLACRAGGDRRGAGFIGQITANSFMKREFGKKLVQNFLRVEINLTHVIDTSGAFIPGHGTPTVILVGRNMLATSASVHVALSVRGEPQLPEDPANGIVWRSIVDNIAASSYSTDWVDIVELPRDQLSSHPWSLQGGGSADLKHAIDARKWTSLKDYASSIGVATTTGNDDTFLVPPHIRSRHPQLPLAVMVEGEDVRNFVIHHSTCTVWPYDAMLNPISLTEGLKRWLWPYRRNLQLRRRFSVPIEQIDGIAWYEFRELYKSKYRSSSTVTFSTVATHNHFALSRELKAFNRHAPVIKLAQDASEERYIELVGLLNSSTACFWLKQVSQPKGGSGIGRGVQDEAWENRYEFMGTKLEPFPLPRQFPLELGLALDSVAQDLSSVEPPSVLRKGLPRRESLDAARVGYASLQERMTALQEELDWEVYRLYGLLTEEEAAELTAQPESIPDLRLGERAFEIILARKMAAEEIETQWFARHRSAPTTELPTHWPEEYRRVVERRIEKIEKLPRTIGLIERPEYKRRWQTELWEKKEKAALRNWLLDRCEDRALWFAPDDMGGEQPQPMTVNRLADRLRGDADFVSVARLYADEDADLADVIAEITEADHVPYLAALRYKDAGLRKRVQWEKTWDLQREEDATGKRLDIPVPPKYASADFLKNSYWRNRGKLDVPKERFISYPGGSPDGDDSLLLGWAGWDHREQAHALMTLIEDRTTRDGWDKERLTPLIAGLAEVMPWAKQWHGEVDPEFGMSPADAYASYLEDQQLRYGLTSDDLTAWRPAKPTRGRRAKADAH